MSVAVGVGDGIMPARTSSFAASSDSRSVGVAAAVGDATGVRCAVAPRASETRVGSLCASQGAAAWPSLRLAKMAAAVIAAMVATSTASGSRAACGRRAAILRPCIDIPPARPRRYRRGASHPDRAVRVIADEGHDGCDGDAAVRGRTRTHWRGKRANGVGARLREGEMLTGVGCVFRVGVGLWCGGMWSLDVGCWRHSRGRL